MNGYEKSNENGASFLCDSSGDNENSGDGLTELDDIVKELEKKQCELILSSLGKYMNEEFARNFDDWKEEAEAVDLPETLEHKLRYLTSKYEKAERHKIKEKKRRKYRKACSLVLAAAVCAGGITLVESEALRERVYNIFFTPGDGHVTIEFREVFGDVTIPDDVKALMYPETLPVNYKLSEYSKDILSTTLVFTDENTEDWVMLRYMKADTILDLDTEKSDNRIIEINGEKAVIQIRENTYDLYWNYDGYSMELTCSREFFSKERIIGIAEHTKFYSIDELESLSGLNLSE